MKRAILKVTFWTMTVFAYLILSIQFYQNAWADDSLPSIKELRSVYLADASGRQFVTGLVAGAMEGYVIGLSDAGAEAVIAAGSDKDWVDAFVDMSTFYWDCNSDKPFAKTRGEIVQAFLFGDQYRDVEEVPFIAALPVWYAHHCGDRVGQMHRAVVKRVLPKEKT